MKGPRRWGGRLLLADHDLKRQGVFDLVTASEVLELPQVISVSRQPGKTSEPISRRRFERRKQTGRRTK